MDEKEKHIPLSADEEKVLDFEQAKDLTVGEAVKKHQEIQVGITEEDGLLDRYIKQHREEINSQKFETAVQPSSDQEEEVQEEPVEELVVETVPVFVEEGEVDPLPPVLGVEEEDGIQPVDEDEVLYIVEDKEEKRRKIFILSALGLAFVGLLATAFVWLNQQKQSGSTASSATSTTSSSQKTISSSKEDVNAQAFQQLYKSFFVDGDLTKLKNAEFGKLAELKALLDKIDTTSDSYKTAKEQYDNLAKAIEAIQTLNGQFDKPILNDGELDTTATVKAGSTLAAVTTGISSVDSQLASAVNFGRSQLDQATATEPVAETASPAQPAAATSATEQAIPAPSQPVVETAANMGMAIPAGVTLQRQLSRVPYDQAKIADTANEAWTFGPGILENILSISRQRGYISGDQYILEKVNIINGNGYYNLFKPDGTYLFSINCKTGYFVGNGSGHSDALDY